VAIALLFVPFVPFCGNSSAEVQEAAQGESEDARQILQSLRRALVVEDIFLDLEFVAAKVDEQAVLDPGRLKVTKNLGDVFVRDLADRFELDDKAVIHDEVGEVFAQQGTVFVINVERVLLLDFEPKLTQTMRQGVFIDLLQVAVAMIEVNVVRGLADGIAKLVDGLHGSFF